MKGKTKEKINKLNEQITNLTIETDRLNTEIIEKNKTINELIHDNRELRATNVTLNSIVSNYNDLEKGTKFKWD